MTSPVPTDHLWWLAGRASGIVALILISASVLLGLGMASKLFRRPGLPRKLNALHEQLAVAGLIAIGVHGVTLLGDSFLHPGDRRDHRAVRDRLPAGLRRRRDRRRLSGCRARPQLLRPPAIRNETSKTTKKKKNS